MTLRSIPIAMLSVLWMANPVMAAGVIEPNQDETSAPAFTLNDLDNTPHSLQDYRGKVVLVNFWASWCTSCLREFPSLERLSRAMDPSRFALLAVNVREGKGTVRRFRSLKEAGMEMLMDSKGAMAGSWGVDVYPTSFIVDAEGIIRESFIGEMDWDDEEKHTYIKALYSADKDE